MKRITLTIGLIAASLILISKDSFAFNLASLNAPGSCNICITTFAHGFIPDSTGAGPFGMAFLPNGTVLVTDTHLVPMSKLYLFPSDTDSSTAPPNCPSGTAGYNAPSFEVGFNRGTLDHFGAVDLSTSLDGRVFATGNQVSGAGVLVELTYDAASNSFTASAPLDSGGFGGGMALDHVSGFIIYDMGGNQIRAFNPTTNTSSILTTGGFTQLDGMDVSADGQFMWAADVGANTLTQFTIVRNGLNQPTGLTSATVQCSGLPGADGIVRGAVGSCLQNFLFCNTNGGVIVQRDLVNGTCSNFLSGGSRGDFMKANCKGWLYASQSDNIALIRDTNGGSLFECSSGPVTSPATNTPTPTDTPTLSPTASATSTATPTLTFTPTNTETPVNTALVTATMALSPSATPTPVASTCPETFGTVATPSFVGGEEVFDYNGSSGVTTSHIATAAYNLSTNGTITSISAVFPAVTPAVITHGEIRLAIYSDAGGHPSSLIAESAPVPYVNGQTIYTAAVPATSLSAGNYWLAAQGSVIGTMPFSSGIQWGDLLLALSSLSGNSVNEAWAYGPFPANFTATSNPGRTYQIWANYCPAGATLTPTPTPSFISTPLVSATPTATATSTPSVQTTQVPVNSFTPTPTATASPTSTATVSFTATSSPTGAATSSVSGTPTVSKATFTPTPTPTSTQGPAHTATPTASFTPGNKCHPVPYPNPCHGNPVWFHCDGGPYDEIHLTVCTTSSRSICRQVHLCHGEEATEVCWDLKDDHGKQVANGIYFATIETHCRGNVQRYVEKVLVLR